jgi:hypothetical protein
LRLTTPLNLPAPGRRQTLYVVFDFAEPCVFSKQSLGAFHCDLPSLHIARILTTASTPSSEVTVLICRVPSRGITHAPWNTLPVYLCRFTVRSPFWITIEVFLGSMDLLTLRAKSPRAVSHVYPDGFTYPSTLLTSGDQFRWFRLSYPPASPLDQLLTEVQEY